MTVNEGATPPDFDTEVGRVRLLTSDTDATPLTPPVSGRGEYLWQGDIEIQALIDLTGSPQHAALRILRLVAMTPALQYKKWSSADLSVDGAAITRALRELINDIERNLDSQTDAATSEYAALVNTGTALGQPALYPQQVPSLNGVDFGANGGLGTVPKRSGDRK